MSYFGLHLQTPINEWDSELLYAAEEGKPYRLAKFFWVEAGIVVKHVSPATVTVFRHYWAHQQPFLDRALVSPMEADAAADQYIAMFKDSVNQHGNIDYVESLNETYPSRDLLAQQKAVAFDRAFIRRLKVHCPDTRPVVYNAPPGNIDHDEYAVLIDLARDCEAAGGAFGYHNYWSVVNKHSYVGSPGHARDYQMRWSDTLDEYLVDRGIRVNYILGESGPIGAGPDGYWQKPNDGWKMYTVWDGDIDGYMSDLVTMEELFESSRAAEEGRLIGATLFTSGNGIGWENFLVDFPLLGRITDHVINYSGQTGPLPPLPPIVDEFEEAAWNLTTEMQRTGQNGIRLNALAGIQQRIKQDNRIDRTDYQIVTSEAQLIDFTVNKTVQAAESLSGTFPRRVYVWTPGQEIYYYENP